MERDKGEIAPRDVEACGCTKRNGGTLCVKCYRSGLVKLMRDPAFREYLRESDVRVVSLSLSQRDYLKRVRFDGIGFFWN